ncbi:hypothetical protein FVEG_05816 [Fusarium verticillioides 7600]|uniref:Zn(2)-C6 fungal-type domain-containing protein n=1 Tax=Gibberella moniliformis (strain M3125 / FGSC 7600) TaxID=334819 RepID=W7LZT9_GIBM7|nr:hypothetical protein FVEG_05816 [Fusarium verticillioides 7600]EWG44838.1 hypothetical protein FVEG_05816 [Fusarium verticillioides 7600]
MFTTFDITTSNTLSSGKPPSPPTSQPRPKRSQVSRACDWCRLTRVKCDSIRPCRNCKQANRECVNSGRDDFKSVAAATREVQRLRSQVQQLENKLLSPSPLPQNTGSVCKRPLTWKGVQVNGIQYGPSSLAYFIHRLSTFTKLSFGTDVLSSQKLPATSSPLNCDRLQREQQDALLDLYWQGYHAIYPVIEEATFRQLYDSLWIDNTKRQACPLVDIVIALCIQFGSSYTICDNVLVPNQHGFDFYLRAQQVLVQYLDCPSLQSTQCYFLSAIYLLALNQENSAYMMIRSAVAAAESLGLQFDSGDKTQDSEDSTCAKPGSRLWRCLVTLDIQVSLHLGRPFAISEPRLYEREHPESDSIAELAGPNFTLSQSSGINWLRFQHERQGLFQAVREIHTEFARVMEDVLSEIGQPDFYQHPSSREKCAKYLYGQLKRLKTWVEELPSSLKTPRVQGVPFSVDRSPLDLSQGDPLWLQRQRLVLEFDYHSLVIMLTRTFNSFLPTPALGTFNSDNHCITCVNSGIMVTNMLNQISRDSGILTGCFQVFDWQRTATFALAGFSCGYPICPMSPHSAEDVDTSCEGF